ncbi:hypothetical protein KHC27_10405 [Ancylobacter lacus]|nr:hypothetical protein [Ancylobacter lacus]
MALGAGGPAAAQTATGTYPGGNCEAMARQTPAPELWYGHFTGRRQSPWNFDFIEGKTVEGCFRSKAECESWLYQWRSAWQFEFWNDYCTKGYPPAPRGWRPRSSGGPGG